MSTPLKIITGILVLVAIVTGIHFLNRTFGVGPRFYIPASWLARSGLFAEELFVAPSPAASQAASVSPTPAPVDAIPSMGKVLVIPLTISDLDDSASLAAQPVASGSSQPADSYAQRLDFIRKIQPAGVVLFGSELSASQAATAISEVKSVAPNTLIMVDHEGGSVQRLSGEGFLDLPSWRTECTLTAAQLAQTTATAAAQLRQVGVDVVLGPVLDLSGGFLGTRACSNNPELIATQAQILIDAYHEHQIKTVIKHFPGIGGVSRDLHTTAALATIRENDLEPFSRVLTANPRQATMVSFLRVAEADEQNPCALSQYCVNEISKYFPKSLLISDALEMKSAGFVSEEELEQSKSGSDNSTEASKSSKHDLVSDSEQPLASPSDEKSSWISDGQVTLSGRAIRALESGIDLLLFGPSVSTDELQKVADDLEARYTSSNIMVVRYATARAKIEQWRAE